MELIDGVEGIAESGLGVLMLQTSDGQVCFGSLPLPDHAVESAKQGQGEPGRQRRH